MNVSYIHEDSEMQFFVFVFVFVFCLWASPGHLGLEIHSALFHCSALQEELNRLHFSRSCMATFQTDLDKENQNARLGNRRREKTHAPAWPPSRRTWIKKIKTRDWGIEEGRRQGLSPSICSLVASPAEFSPSGLQLAPAVQANCYYSSLDCFLRPCLDSNLLHHWSN